jgi:hypothetical protein
MELWFSLPTREMNRAEKICEVPANRQPEEYTNTTIFTWSWLEQFERVIRAQTLLLENLLSPNAFDEIVKIATNKVGKLENKNYSINLEFSGDAVELHSTSQFQKIEYPLSPRDDLYGSLGNFMICAAITKCSVHNLGVDHLQPEVTVHEIGMYMKDTYDFIGDQYLGHWCDEGLKISTSGGIQNLRKKEEYDEADEFDSNGDPIEAFGNSDFNRFRAENQRGGDLLLFSDVKFIETMINRKTVQDKALNRSISWLA